MSNFIRSAPSASCADRVDSGPIPYPFNSWGDYDSNEENVQASSRNDELRGWAPSPADEAFLSEWTPICASEAPALLYGAEAFFDDGFHDFEYLCALLENGEFDAFDEYADEAEEDDEEDDVEEEARQELEKEAIQEYLDGRREFQEQFYDFGGDLNPETREYMGLEDQDEDEFGFTQQDRRFREQEIESESESDNYN